MLKIFSKRMKKRIGIASLTFFLCSPLSYIHINWTEAAPPPPPNQTEKQPPPKKPAPKPNVNRPKPPAPKPAPRPNINRPKPSAPRHAPRPNINRPKPPAPKPAPRSNVNRPKPSAPKPAPRPNINRPKPPAPKPAPRPNVNRPKPNNNFKPPTTKPGNGFKPPVTKPNIKPSKPGIKPPMVKPSVKPPKPGDGFKPPITKPNIKPPKPNMHNPKGPRPNIKPPKKSVAPPPPPQIAPPAPRVAPQPPPPYYEYEEDKPSVWERILTGIFIERMSFARDNAALTAELNDMGFECAGLDLEYPDKYVQIYCNSYDGAGNTHIDYYLDKTSLKVLNYNPPYYTIKVNEYSTDTSKPMDRQMNTWEFKYDINSKTVVFTNLYGDYHHKYKNSNRMDLYTIEPDIAAMAEMAFYMAYNMKFFGNQADSFYDVQTL